MRTVVGAILIVAASILVAGGLVAEQLKHNNPPLKGGIGGTPGFLLGAIVGLFGIVNFLPVKQDKKPP